MSTVDGWNLISMPAWPAPQTIEWSIVDNDGISVSPFNNKQQVYDWGHAHMEASLTYPPLTRAQAFRFWSFLMA